ncbi:cytochrome P450 [Labrys sp. La1]|uniref:cytochrome P450 n=1 Tax=Labrys sp. La1 TaxID=3404917 RepID=UPI003EB82890
MTEQAAQQINSDIPIFTIAELDQDTHALFRKFRPETPFIQRDDGPLFILRAKDVVSLTTDERTRQIETELLQLRGVTSGPLFDFYDKCMLLSNGAAHRRRRGPMARTFAFKMVAEVRPKVRAMAEKLIDQHYEAGGLDLFEDYSAIIPAHTVAAILGMPEADIPKFAQWIYVIARSLGTSWTEKDIPDLEDACRQMTDYMYELVAERRQNPRGDFLSDYITAIDENPEMTPLEAIMQIIIVVLGGSDTTRASMAIQAALLLEHPEQWQSVCADPSLIPGAVSEALRFEPSVASLPRLVLEEIEIGGQKLAPGSLLMLSTMSALRDPEVFGEPDQFDIRRTDHTRWHYVFGGGAHRCLGEALAKAELEEGLAALVNRIPQAKLVGKLKVEGHGGIRRAEDLRLEWTR